MAVVQFAAQAAAPLEEEFLQGMQRKDMNLETRFAMVRYFQRRVYLPAKDVLLSMVSEEDGNGLAIATAAALSRYPGEDTYQTLMGAVCSRNYHVRRNAAASLVSLGATEKDIQRLRDANDPYAAEMLEYMLQQSPAEKSAPVRDKVKKEAVCV